MKLGSEEELDKKRLTTLRIYEFLRMKPLSFMGLITTENT